MRQHLGFRLGWVAQCAQWGGAEEAAAAAAPAAGPPRPTAQAARRSPSRHAQPPCSPSSETISSFCLQVREGADFVSRLQTENLWVVVLEKMRKGLG